MKKKLLITMGCSMTEGVGCYDVNTIDDKYLSMTVDDIWVDENIKDLYIINQKNADRFHEFGWPNQIGKKLGYDKVINLGLGGSATSSQVKIFFEKYPTETFDDWEVLIMFMLPEPARFSFYVGEEISHFLPHLGGEIEKAYLNLPQNNFEDQLCEQIFYIKIMEEVCKNRNFNFIYFNHDIFVNNTLDIAYKNKTNHLKLSAVDGMLVRNNKQKYKSPICHHPNELGYEYIANQIFKCVEDEFPQYLTEPKDEIEWEWNGNPQVENAYNHII